MTEATNLKPLVSIIMIFFNAEKFIEEAIQSVFAQPYENWELIMVDDGSTDGSSKIAQKYAQQQQGRVRYLEHPQHQNYGRSASRNLGIRDAKGEYITFFDSDDFWLPGKLQQQTAILAAHPEVGLVCSPAQWWYGWTGRPEDLERDFVQRLDVPRDTVLEGHDILLLYLQNEWASICDLLARREVVEAVGGWEPTFRGMYDDQVFHAKLCLRFAAFVTSEWWYRYRQHPDSCTASSHRAGQYHSTRRIFLYWLQEHLSKGGDNNNAELWKVLRKELWSVRHPRLSHIVRHIQGWQRR